ncbi:MAG: Gfo/Idh/MocA family oxidoreductase [Ignavibacteria bacterium]|jgi:predicted dehydrogenase|nr:Gfo/Idh/MocA family oxidoreductase [Ignavibacteria bacterium]MCU7504553.1 Gfo/Idh/MocA family oxidoreductase [Ignavibacteria bacterium]MCU7516609.1 Gfo/Idh/MocA family oxidoreductase [Ignavibacteria bacterium]
MKKVKLGIIGCGIAARELHLPALRKLQDKFEITMLCNHTEQKARDLSEQLGRVPYVLDYRELLESSEVEAVDIALPIHLNFKVAKDSLLKGKHVFVEKPVTANLREARKILSQSEASDLVMLVAENFRYRKVYLRAKELMKKGKIGKPYAAMWDLFNQVTLNSKYAKTKWRQHPKYPGAFVSDGGVHNVAALRMLFGEFTSVKAFTKSINPKIGSPDTMSLQFRSQSGVDGVFNIFYSVDGYWENRLLIFGSRGSIIIQENKLMLKNNSEDDYIEEVEDDNGYIAEFTDFYNGIRKKKKVLSTPHEGLKDLEVIIAALKSAESNRSVSLTH